jgi:hypothetical protein
MEKDVEKKFEEVEDNLDKVMLENRDLDTRVSTIEGKLKEQEDKK